jgi:hypothetical protein
VACHYFDEVQSGTKEVTGPVTDDPASVKAGALA